MTNLKSSFFPRRWIQYSAALTATISIFTGGIQWVWTSPSLPKLYHDNSSIPTTHDEGSWLASMVLIGAIIGSVVGAFTADRYGRKATIIATAASQFVSWLIMIFAASIPILCVARFIAGVAGGCTYTVTPLYVAEIVETEIRGKLGGAITIMLVSGILFMYSVGPFITIPEMAALCTIFPLLLIVIFSWMPESPYYYLAKKDNAKAQTSLQALRGKTDIDAELKEISDSVEEQMQMSTSWKELFVVKSNLKALIVVIGLVSIQEFGGAPALSFYPQLIFEQAESGIPPSLSTIIFGLVQVVMCVVGSLTVDWLGRKPLMVISCIGSAVGSGAQSVYFYLQEFTEHDTTKFNWFPLSAMTLYVITLSLGISVMPFLMAGELFPSNVKAKATCLMILYSNLASFVVTKFYQQVVDELGNYVPFAAFGVVCFIGALFSIFYIPETKNKSLDEIQNILKGKKIITSHL